MSGKTHMSDKSKKILTGVGIGFGTVMVFLVSFILAFSLIINPINFFTVSDAGTVEENEKLKEEVQTLNDRIEHLNTTVDKYKAQSSAPAPSSPAIVTTPSAGTASGNAAQQPQGGNEAQTPTTNEADSGENAGEQDAAQGGEFSPDVVDSTAEQTPEDVEVPITVIDISE